MNGDISGVLVPERSVVLESQQITVFVTSKQIVKDRDTDGNNLELRYRCQAALILSCPAELGHSSRFA